MGEKPRLAMLERFYQNKKFLLKKSQDFFQKNSSLVPKIGIELEFFLLEENSLSPANIDLANDFILLLQENFRQKNLLIIAVEKEQGASQIEIKTAFTSDLARLCEEIDDAKNFIFELAKQKNLQASFAGKPIAEDCGSALQLNISLHDSSERNVFENDYEALNGIASKLLNHTAEMMIFLAPNTEDYLRFLPQLNKQLFRQGKNMAPVNVSFGNDNRSCAIRVPSVKAPFICPEDRRDYKFDYGQRLEYRVPSASADLWLVTSVVLLAMSVEEKKSMTQKFTQIYGNAFDEQYALQPLLTSLQDAKKEFSNTDNSIRIIIESFNS
jgi:glutamine synthetase